MFLKKTLFLLFALATLPTVLALTTSSEMINANFFEIVLEKKSNDLAEITIFGTDNSKSYRSCYWFDNRETEVCEKFFVDVSPFRKRFSTSFKSYDNFFVEICDENNTCKSDYLTNDNSGPQLFLLTPVFLIDSDYFSFQIQIWMVLFGVLLVTYWYSNR